jgi:signal transduction histidine kinase
VAIEQGSGGDYQMQILQARTDWRKNISHTNFDIGTFSCRKCYSASLQTWTSKQETLQTILVPNYYLAHRRRSRDLAPRFAWTFGRYSERFAPISLFSSIMAAPQNALNTLYGSFDDSWIDTRLISPMRLVLSATALLIIYIDPSQPDRLVWLTYGLLIGYTAYSTIVFLLAWASPKYLPLGILHWLDLAWYVALIAASSGTNSIFFLFFFFAILVASFRCGFASGAKTTAVSALLFVTVGYLTAPSVPDFQLNRFLLRAVTLIVLGYMIAYWGSSEIELKRRLKLLKDVTNLSNPRFGIDRTVTLGLERLREFYNARACVLIYASSSPNTYKLLRAEQQKADSAQPQEVPQEVGKLLLQPAANIAVLRARQSSSSLLYDLVNGTPSREDSPELNAIAQTLSARQFTSLPVMHRREFIGRLYVIDSARRRLNGSDIEFMRQLIDQVSPLLDNIRLLDQLASDAAEQERKKLARDIHDSVIQPYVGLQLGLAAVRQRLLSENSATLGTVTELCEVTNNEVRSLRNYLDQLKAAEVKAGVLVPAVRRFAANFTAVTGISVQIKGDQDLQLNDRLAAEVFQMISEALSNIRRHTSAQQASVDIACDSKDLILKVTNENCDGVSNGSFRPRSIAERAAALGGHTAVFQDDANRTVVAIQIPL